MGVIVLHKVGVPARAYRTSAFNLTVSTWTKVPIDTVDYDIVGDPASYFGGSSARLVTNGNQYVCANPGLFSVKAQVSVAVSASPTTLCVGVAVNGSLRTVAGGVFPSALFIAAPAVEDDLLITASDIASGGKIQLYGLSNVAALNVGGVGGAAVSSCNFLTVQQIA